MQKSEKGKKSAKKAKNGENYVRNFNKPFGYDAIPIQDPDDNLFNGDFSDTVEIKNGGTNGLFSSCDSENLFE